MSKTAQLLQTATTHHQAGRLADAEKAYRQLLRVEAAHVDALRLLGGLYLQTNQPRLAVENLEKAARLMPKDAEILTNLGISLRAIGRLQEAETCYRQALEAQPGYIHAMNNLAALYHESGRAAEAMAIYAQALKLHPGQATAHYNYANSLFMAGRSAEAIACYEQALKLKPDYLEAMINLGMALGQAGKSDRSREWLELGRSWFDKALKTDPNNVVAMNNIGNVLRQQGKPEEAVAYYRRALELRPGYVQASINLATALRDIGRIEDAMESCRAALRLMPESVDARINLGCFLQELARHEEAVALFDEALARKATSLDAQWNKSISMLALGNYSEGWALHEAGLGVTHMRGDDVAPEKRWKGEEFAGKTLLLWAEQGLGDSLQFIRYAEMCKARGGRVIMMCPRPLRPVFANCGFIDALPESLEPQDFDLHAPMMSLPYIFGTQVETIPARVPYLHISEAVRARWAGKIPARNGFRVGLVWTGNPRENRLAANLVDRRRSMTLETLLPLFDVPGVEFYNLQMGASVAQIDELALRGRFVDLMEDVQDFEDTGAIIEQLDLVISVDTSVVHLAGGMGRPVWVLSRFDACWRWMRNRPDSPWYPTARVFGQQAPGDWAGVVERVREALALLVK